MKIAFKLPMADELAASLCALGDADAGAALKNVLNYISNREISSLPAAAQGVFEDWRRLVDLSRKRAEAGRAGGKIENFAGSKRDFAGDKPVFVGSKPTFALSKPDLAPSKPDELDVLDGLDAFL